jgi:hypothetical protein
MMSHCNALHAFVSGTCLHHKPTISWNFNIICAKIVKSMCVQNLWASKCENGIKYINVSFLLVMFWYEIRIIYILTKCVQLSWYNFG